MYDAGTIAFHYVVLNHLYSGGGTFVQIKKECQRLHKNYYICTNFVNRCCNTVALQCYRISSLVYTMQFCKQWCYTNTRKHLQLALKCIFKDSLKWHFSWKWTINLRWRYLHCVKKIVVVQIIRRNLCGSGFLLVANYESLFKRME